jgi:hypothetical protein
MGTISELGSVRNRHLMGALLVPLLLLPGIQSAIYYSAGNFLNLPLLSVVIRAAVWGLSLFVLTYPFWVFLVNLDHSVQAEATDDIILLIDALIAVAFNTLVSTFVFSCLYFLNFTITHKQAWFFIGAGCILTPLTIILIDTRSLKKKNSKRSSA